MVIDNYFFIASDDEINNESTTQQPTHSDDDEAPLSELLTKQNKSAPENDSIEQDSPSSSSLSMPSSPVQPPDNSDNECLSSLPKRHGRSRGRGRGNTHGRSRSCVRRRSHKTSKENEAETDEDSPNPGPSGQTAGSKKGKAKVPKKKNNAKKKSEAKKAKDPPLYKWTDTQRKDRREFLFDGAPGIKILPDDPESTLSCLKLFITDEIVEGWTKYTNNYASALINTPEIRERIEKKKQSMYAKWVDVDVDEMWAFIAVLILMGITIKPRYYLYWSRDPFFHTPIFPRLMSRNRFYEIRSMIHFSDVFNFDKDDALNKLRFFLDEVQERFQSVYEPERNICVDEYLSLWKGRLRFRVYIPSKRERYGIKIFMNCESSSGYLLRFIVYTGEGTDYGEFNHVLPKSKPFDDYKSPSRVVLSLVQKYINHGYILTLDNYYTSPELAEALLHFKTDCFGTLRKKAELPEDFWEWKPKKFDGPICQTSGDMMVMRWNDASKTKKTKIVSMLSTMHTGAMHDSGKKKRDTDETIEKPDVILDYNKSMGGVDTLSRVLIPYSCQRKGVKWYRKLAELFLDICIYNSFCIWKKLNLNKGSTNHLDYRKLLIEEIVTHHSYGYGTKQSGKRNVGDNPMRLGGRHFPEQYPKTGKKTYAQVQCVRCSALKRRKDSRYWCRECGVGLCLEKCFRIYHTKKHYELSESESESKND